MILTQIFPERMEVAVEDVYTALGFHSIDLEGRPYVAVNMISSADGKASAGGKSGVIGGEVDRELFIQLRTQVDAVMVGTGTVRSEGYGRLVRRPELRELRERRGLDPDPLAVLVSRSMDLPIDAPLLQDPDSRVVVFTNSDREIEDVAAQVEVERSDGRELPLGRVLRQLRERYGVRSLLLEGGPTLNGAMVEASLVDELFITLSPKLVSGRDVPTIVSGERLEPPLGLELVTAFEHEGYLFLRYRDAR